MKKTLLFLAVVLMGLSMMAQTTYTRVSSASELEAGANYLIVGYDDALGYCAMSYQKTNNRHAIQVSEDGGSITLTPASDPSSLTEAYQITLGGGEGAWTFFDDVKGGYLYAASSSSNYLKTQTSNNANGEWTIVFDNEGTAVVKAQGENTRNVMRFNENSSNGTPLFNCYAETSTAGVNIAFYKEGGGGTIYPEPSEYPSTFYITIEGTSATLDWTDAGGAQLPQKYLVLASTGAINVPVDGTPVANGPLAKNVAYGVEMVTFDGLNGGTTYHFAIFPYTNSGANIDYKTDGDYPTASGKTDNVQTLLSADFATDLAPFTAISVEGEQVWNTASYSGKTYAVMNGYYDGTNYANEDWLISPDIFANGYDFDAVTVAFETAYKHDGDPLQIFFSADYDGVGDPNDFEWVDRTYLFDWSTGNFTWVSTENTFVVEEGITSLYIAFVYTSTTSDGSAWEVTNVNVRGINYASTDENETVKFDVYPNPANDVVRINVENDAMVQIVDMAGRVMMNVNVVAGENTINVADLRSGVYFVKMNGTVVKFVKR